MGKETERPAEVILLLTPPATGCCREGRGEGLAWHPPSQWPVPPASPGATQDRQEKQGPGTQRRREKGRAELAAGGSAFLDPGLALSYFPVTTESPLLTIAVLRHRLLHASVNSQAQVPQGGPNASRLLFGTPWPLWESFARTSWAAGMIAGATLWALKAPTRRGDGSRSVHSGFYR